MLPQSCLRGSLLASYLSESLQDNRGSHHSIPVSIRYSFTVKTVDQRINGLVCQLYRSSSVELVDYDRELSIDLVIIKLAGACVGVTAAAVCKT